MEKGLTNYFENFLEKESLFTNKKALQSNYLPETLAHRDTQIQQIAQILAPVLKQEKPSNLFIYGKTGTGKTVSMKHIIRDLSKISEEKAIPLHMCYVNCKLKKITDTEYRLLAHLARELGKEIPSTGLPTDEVYKIFFSALEQKKHMFVLILDEIDWLIKKTGDEILYNLTRINAELEHSQITLVGISNDLVFTDSLDPRVKSSLSEEEILFPPYNALQIQEILNQRAAIAFQKKKLVPGVVEKCAAFAARDHGDARRALELLRVAGELAERSDMKKVEIKHLDQAEDKIERDRMVEAVATQPKQVQATLYAILNIPQEKNNLIFTGEVYNIYKGLCLKTGLRPLTQRRVSDVIGELDMLGIINAKVISKGRYGRTREISIPLSTEITTELKSLLEDGLAFV
tara:strand:+ start:1147 stop:2355 length:1209 start_codon:yes stop_codon:yes gene_type:complete